MANGLDHTDIRRKLAASTLDQVANFLDRQAGELSSSSVHRTALIAGGQGIRYVANRIRYGQVPEKEWEFLTWLAEDQKVAFPVLDATFVENPSSGSRKEKPAGDSVSTQTRSRKKRSSKESTSELKTANPTT